MCDFKRMMSSRNDASKVQKVTIEFYQGTSFICPVRHQDGA